MRYAPLDLERIKDNIMSDLFCFSKFNSFSIVPCVTWCDVPYEKYLIDDIRAALVGDNDCKMLLSKGPDMKDIWERYKG